MDHDSAQQTVRDVPSLVGEIATRDRPASLAVVSAYRYVRSLDRSYQIALHLWLSREPGDDEEERGLWARTDLLKRALDEARERYITISARELGL